MSMPGAFVIFGATGDLARRMLFPSLYFLDADGLLPTGLRIVGAARSSHSDEEFRKDVEGWVRERAGTFFSPEAFASFAQRLVYVPGDATDPKSYATLKQKIAGTHGGALFYLSTSPALYIPIVQGLASQGLTADPNRVIVEKPIGKSWETCEQINAAIAEHFSENRTFRIDHYLGKETVQNLLALRFANIMFEPLWNAAHIDHVQITVAETVGLESRAGYYDGAGALRDMVQNHMLQLLALVGMEPPASFDATSVRDEKVKVLRALRLIDPDETVTGQYRKGAIDGQPVAGYDDELGRDSDTETFVAIKAHIDNWRWKGVPFYLRTGKRMPERKTEIVVQFRRVPHSIFAGKGATTQPNRLIIGIQPEENIRLSVMAKVPGLDRGGLRLREVPLDISMPNAFAGVKKRIAYERLLLDLIEGDQTLFVRRDEVEAQWDWIDTIRAGWSEHGMTPKPYTAGSWGPSAAIALAEREGVTWHE